jgi:hypothetical protein
MDQSDLDIYDLARTALAAIDRFGPFELTAQERMIFGSVIHPLAPEFVHLVAEGLCEDPALFSYYKVTGPALIERQRHAAAWKVAARAFYLLHVWANDRYLYEQAGAVQDASLTLQQVEAERDIPMGADPLWHRRWLLLQLAFALQDKRRARARRNARKGPKQGRRSPKKKKAPRRGAVREALARRGRSR